MSFGRADHGQRIHIVGTGLLDDQRSWGMATMSLAIASLLAVDRVSAQEGVLQDSSAMGYRLNVSYPGHAGERLAFGHYYDYMVMHNAECVLDTTGACVFSGREPLRTGLYTFILEGQVLPGDFIMDKEQRLKIVLHDGDLESSVIRSFSVSPENDDLLDYQRFSAREGRDIASFNRQLATAHDAVDSAHYSAELAAASERIYEYRSRLIEKSKGTFLSTMLSAMQEPRLPEELLVQKNRADTIAAHDYKRSHFWDGAYFWDGRLAYTPFFSEKLDKYFREILPSEKDTVIKELDRILANAVADERMYRLILRKVTIGSMTHFFKWEDAVFIHLYEKFIAPQKLEWIRESELNDINEHALFVMGNNHGDKSPDIELPALDGSMDRLHAMNAEHVLLVFWDPTCHHCKETLPRVDSLYRANWKSQGIRVYAVCSGPDELKPVWTEYVKEHELGDWHNVYYSSETERKMMEEGAPSVAQAYDVWFYPTFFLLDKDQRFMANKLAFPQMRDLIDSILARKGEEQDQGR